MKGYDSMGHFMPRRQAIRAERGLPYATGADEPPEWRNHPGMTGPDDCDALSRALIRQQPELAGHVHYLDGLPWCDGINHTTMCQPGTQPETRPAA